VSSIFAKARRGRRKKQRTWRKNIVVYVISKQTKVSKKFSK